MVYCEFGAHPRPGAPSTFVFEEAWLLNLFGIIGNRQIQFAAYAVQVAMGLPSDPQNTADYVAHEPTGELATDDDYAALFFPPAGFLSGAFERLGNTARLAKWRELAECNAPPPNDPSLSEQVCNIPIHRPDAGELIGWCGPLDGYAYFDLVVSQPVTDTTPRTDIQFISSTTPPGDAPITQTDYVHLGGGLSSTSWYGPNGMNLTAGSPAHNGVYVTVWWIEQGTDPPFLTAVHVIGHKSATVYDPDTPPVGPPPPPADVTDCAGCGRAVQDLAAKVDLLIQMVRYQAATSVPSEVYSDETPTPITPAPARIHKPRDAVGIVIEVTSIPAHIAHHGRDPMFWGGLGHLAMLTPDGPLPSQLIKHNPLVVFPIPFVVTDLAVDLSDGVVGQLRWLRGYK